MREATLLFHIVIIKVAVSVIWPRWGTARLLLPLLLCPWPVFFSLSPCFFPSFIVFFLLLLLSVRTRTCTSKIKNSSITFLTLNKFTPERRLFAFTIVTLQTFMYIIVKYKPHTVAQVKLTLWALLITG